MKKGYFKRKNVKIRLFCFAMKCYYENRLLNTIYSLLSFYLLYKCFIIWCNVIIVWSRVGSKPDQTVVSYWHFKYVCGPVVDVLSSERTHAHTQSCQPRLGFGPGPCMTTVLCTHRNPTVHDLHSHRSERVRVCVWGRKLPQASRA